jgi:kinesin family member 6/9
MTNRQLAGSGKTFTLTGGQERYSDRGIIPRTLSMLFQEMRNGSDVQYSFYVSYMEIYNEQVCSFKLPHFIINEL